MSTSTTELRNAMQKVKLFTRSGEYVCTVSVPNFNPPVEVITWGSRCFVLIGNTATGTKYVEGMMYAAIGDVQYEQEAKDETVEQERAVGMPRTLGMGFGPSK